MKQKGSVLAIDRGKKYIGCAYALQGSTIVFPIGYLLNDSSCMTSLSDIIARYRVKHIVIGVPHDDRAKKQIEHFTKAVARLVDTPEAVEFFDEDYSSVQAGATLGNFQKNVAEDTLAAMVILERWIAAQQTDE